MFKNRKRINEYKRISNSVRLPELKSKEKNFEVRRKEKMNKKAIASGILAATICGAIFLTNIGTNFKGIENNGGSLIVYASENNGANKQLFEKGKEIAINSVSVITDDKTGNMYSVKKGAQLSILSDDIKSLKLSTNKGEFMNEFQFNETNINNFNEKSIGEKYIDSDKKEKIYDYNVSKDRKSIEVNNVNNKVLGIAWALSPEMEKMDKNQFGEVEINITAEYKDGKTANETIVLTLNDKGMFVGKLK